jgi:hypothetical protein
LNLTDIRIARLAVNLEPLTFQGAINGCDLILSLDGIIGNMVNGDDELGHDGHSFHESDDEFPSLTYAGVMPGNDPPPTQAADDCPWRFDSLAG